MRCLRLLIVLLLVYVDLSFAVRVLRLDEGEDRDASQLEVLEEYPCTEEDNLNFTDVLVSTWHTYTDSDTERSESGGLDTFQGQIKVTKRLVTGLVSQVEQFKPSCKTLRVMLGPEFVFRIPFTNAADETPPLTPEQADTVIKQTRHALKIALNNNSALEARWVVMPGTVYWGFEKLDGEKGFDVFNIAPLLYRQYGRDRVALFSKMEFSGVDGVRKHEREGWPYYQGFSWDDAKTAKEEEALRNSRRARLFTSSDARIKKARNLVQSLHPAWTPLFIGHLKITVDICLDFGTTGSAASRLNKGYLASRVRPHRKENYAEGWEMRPDGFDLVLLTSAGMKLEEGQLAMAPGGVVAHSDGSFNFDTVVQFPNKHKTFIGWLRKSSSVNKYEVAKLLRLSMNQTDGITTSIWKPVAVKHF